MDRQSTPTDGVRGGDPLGEDSLSEDPMHGAYRSQRAYEGYGPPPPRGRRLDPSALFVLLDGLRRVVPRELEAQLTNLIREFLLTLRALIDWYLERLDRPPREPRVEDIPID
jgi:hypothetical protein